MMRQIVAVFLVAVCALCAAATPVLKIPDEPLGIAGARVPPNLLLDLSLTFVDAGAAYRDAYHSATNYDGYFNSRLCYTYPTKAPLDEHSAYFAVAGLASASKGCSGAKFSGNLMNWATTSTLDLLRLGLTGGDRVIDESGVTVLQRAWLPDGAFHADFYAHPNYFPRKAVVAGTGLPFAADTAYIVSCRNRVLFSNTHKGSNCDAPRLGAGGRRLVSDKYFGEFLVRVQVCTSLDAASRPRLCQKVGNGSYKPEGALQAVSGAARVGVMSYLTEFGAGDANLYGGVLRAPLDFIGALAAPAPDFASEANRHATWDATSGVLASAGAIAYINTLGRSNPARLGAYKAAEPGAELYYESLRYLQGQPGDGKVSIDDAMAVATVRADPVTSRCQRQAIATIGHAVFAEDRYLPGNARTDHLDRARAADGEFNITQQMRRVGALEGDSGSGNPAPQASLRSLDLIDDGLGGAGSLYLAGAAYWAHGQAIRPDKSVRVDNVVLELGAPSQAGASALYLAAKYGGFDDRNGDANPFRSTPGRGSTSEWSVDGTSPASYFSGSDPHTLVDATWSLIMSAARGRGSALSTAPASGNDNAGRFLVQTSYDRWHWNGSVQRIGIGVDANGVQAGDTAVWKASSVLDGDSARQPPRAPRPMPSGRRIYTLSATQGRAPATVPFSWSALNDEQRAQLAGVDALGEARVAYLRGDRSGELGRTDGVFRRRASALGDIVHSAPLVVGAPSAAVRGADYGAFYTRYKQRRQAVYVGANDGMLHALDASDGTELFAYVPAVLLPSLAQLTSVDYRHRAFVDGSPGAAEAMIAGQWRTVLASGMGMGARGVFALDVSDPAAFADGMGALWEFTERDDPAIGFVGAAPQIVKLRVGTQGRAGVFRYFVLVTSGVNNYGAGAGRSSAGGALFLLALDKARDAPWRLGVNYYRFDTPVSAPDAANALGPPAVAVSADGSALRAWAGDLQGNLWRVDFAGRPPWTGALAQTPLFVARDALGKRQALMQAPRVVYAAGGGYLVVIGTGKWLDTEDLLPAGFGPQSVYAVHDDAAAAQTTVGGRTSLAPRWLAGDAAYTIRGEPFSLSGPGAKQGWYFDFPGTRDGERLGGGIGLAAGTVFIDSVLPGSDACVAPGRRSYTLDVLSGFALGADGVARAGASTGVLVAGQSVTAPLVLALDTQIGGRTASGGRSAVRSFALVRPGAEMSAPTLDIVRLTLQGGRVSWREVANWQALHAAAAK